MRVVVYAEGVGELADARFSTPSAPVSAIPDVDLGAAHFLVRRLLRQIDERRFSSVQFDEPLRVVPNSRAPRGSDLRSRKTLRRLLSWGTPRRPALAVVLVDEDDDAERLRTLRSYLDVDWVPPVAIGVSVREFESWLITDMNTLRSYLGSTLPTPGSVEDLAPGEAKSLLSRWTQELKASKQVSHVHREIAERLSLEVLLDGSRSFRRFHEELREKVSLIP